MKVFLNNIELFSSSHIEDVSLIFYCLLNRTPILISGKNEQHIDQSRHE